MVWVLLALSYLIGATPTSYWVGRAVHSLDLRAHGSGNLGATNALRVLGWKSAVPVVVVDIAKGWAPAALFPAIAGVAFPWSFGFGVAAILGHMCSPWVGFKGGKGMATGAGVFLALAPMAVGMGFLIWLVITWVTGYVSLASISVAAALPPLITFTPHEGGVTLVWLTTVLAVFIVWKHRSNIGRLMRGEENRFCRAPESGVTAEEAP